VKKRGKALDFNQLAAQIVKQTTPSQKASKTSQTTKRKPKRK
jgi:hypothetical protein